MKFRGTALLVALTLLLGGFYLLYQRPQAEAKKTAAEFEKRFFRAEANEIKSIIVENREGKVEISHGAEGWLIEKPQRYRPDDGIIRKLLETIATGQLIKVVGETTDLSQFGFDHPVLSLTLGLGQKREVLAIGQKNPTDTGYYAYSESLGKIFLVNKDLPRELYLRLYDLREKRLYPEIRLEDIGRVTISRGGQKLDIALGGGVWRINSPFAAAAAPDEMKVFLDTMIGQKAAAFVPWEKALDKLPQRIRLQLLDLNGRSLVDNMVYYRGTGENEGVVVHTAGSAEAVRAPREFWELLQIEPTDLVERHPFPRNPAGVTRISVVTGSEQIVLERQGSRWLKNGSRIESTNMRIILDFLRNWKVTRHVQEKEPFGKARTVIEVSDAEGVERLAVSDRDMSRAMSTSLPTMDADNKDVVYFLATSSALDRNVLIGSHELDRFLRQIRQLK